eukprot:gene11168-13684_t
MLKHRNITIERIEKFLSDTYFTEVNLYGKVYPLRSKTAVSLIVSERCDRISYKDAMNLNYKSCEVGDSFGPSWATYWFKVQVEVPKDWTNKLVYFIWNSNSEALIWSNGVPIQGLTGGTGCDRREEYKLLDCSKGGEKFDFEIEMACNGMFGVGNAGLINPCDPNKTFQLNKAEIAVLDKDCYDLFTYVQMLYDIAKNYPEDSVRSSQAIWVANDIINKCDTSNRSTFKQCIEMAESFFKQKNGQSQTNVSAIGHCHIDVAWLWPYDETKRKCARSFATQTLYMDYYPEYKFVQSQAQLYSWTKHLYPELYEKIKQKVSTGQFIPTGGTWVEMDGNIPSGESFIRQFLLGQNFFKKEFGKYCTEFWLPDTFGYSGQFPQIIKHMGINNFVTQKLSWNNINKFPHSTFIWEGIDGSQVLTHFPPAATYNSAADVKEIYQSAINNKDIDRSNESLLVYGHGDGGGGPVIPMIERILKLKDTDGIPHVAMRTPKEFFDRVEPNKSKLLTWIGELYFELHRGTYTSQAATKKGNRVCELELKAAELISFYCDLFVPGFKYPDFNSLWELVLLNQFHDVLPGSSIGMVYQDSFEHHQKVLYETKAIIENCLDSIINTMKQIEGASEDDLNVLVFNPNDFEIERIVEVPVTSQQTGQQQVSHNFKLLSTIKVQPNGFKIVNLKDLVSAYLPPKVPVTLVQNRDQSITIHNQFIRVTFNSKGFITSLVELETGRELIPKGDYGNKFVLLQDIPLFWEAWDFEIYSLEKPIPTQPVGSLKVLESGPLRAVLRAEFTNFPSSASSLSQLIIINYNSARIDFETEVEWRESRTMLKVEFPTNIRSTSATYDIQFGHLQRPTHYNTSWDMAKFEVCGHKWADLSEYGIGMALLNNCKYGYSVHGGIMSMSLLRSPKAPDVNCDMGYHKFTYSILPHTGTFQSSGVIKQGYHLNTHFYMSKPFHILPSINRDCSFISTDHESVIIEAVKRAEDGNGHIVRVYESFGGTSNFKFTSSIPFNKIISCNGLEEPIGDENDHYTWTKSEVHDPLSFNHISSTIPISPFQIKTFRIF